MFLSIQYLRAISAVAVVFVHTVGFTGGQGVAIFFAISGFLMIDIMERKKRTAQEFFKARFFRIAPLYYLLTLVTLFLGIAYDPNFVRILQSFTFTALGSVLPVGFTLTYEFVFYTLCAVSIFLLNEKRKNIRLIFILSFLLIGDTILNYILTSKGYMYGNYFWIFIFGMSTYYIYKSYNVIPNIFLNKWSLYLIFWSSLVFIFGMSFTNTDIYISDVNHYAINNTLPAFLILLTILLIEKIYGIAKNKFLILLGDASYSIYLVHYIVIQSIYKYYDDNFNVFVLFIVSILSGVLAYKYIEVPLNKYVKVRFAYNV